MCQEYSFDYLRMLLHSFAYINHRPSFDGGLHQYNILEICHVKIMQQQYKDVSVIRNNSDFAFCIFHGTTQDLLDSSSSLCQISDTRPRPVTFFLWHI